MPDISPTQYDIRAMLKGARALNNGEPFPGERLLHPLLDKTYYAHILPPLDEPEGSRRTSAETELKELLGKGDQALGTFIGWLERVRANFNTRRR